MVGSIEKLALIFADNPAFSFITHTTWTASDFTRHVWVLGGRQILLGLLTNLRTKGKYQAHFQVLIG